MEKSSPLLYVRIGLQGLEWIFSLTVFSVVASLGGAVGTFFTFMYAWDIIGWLLCTAMLVLTLLYRFTSVDFFTAQMEVYVQSAMAVLFWFILSMMASFGIYAGTTLGALIIALFWVNLVLASVSATVSSYDAKRGSSEGSKPAVTAVDDEL